MSEPPPDLRVHVPDAPERGGAGAGARAWRATRPSGRRPPASWCGELCEAFEAPTRAGPGGPERTSRDRAAARRPARPSATTRLPRWPRGRPRRAAPRASAAPGRAAAVGPTAAGCCPSPRWSSRCWPWRLVLALAERRRRRAAAGRRSASSSRRRRRPERGGRQRRQRRRGQRRRRAVGLRGRRRGSRGGGGVRRARPRRPSRDFYTRAANDDFEGAWELAGPGVREQLGGFDGFAQHARHPRVDRVPDARGRRPRRGNRRPSRSRRSRRTRTTDRCTRHRELTRRAAASWKIERLNVDCNEPSGAELRQGPRRAAAAGADERRAGAAQRGRLAIAPRWT